MRFRSSPLPLMDGWRPLQIKRRCKTEASPSSNLIIGGTSNEISNGPFIAVQLISTIPAG
jgi:hypothetical protein